MGRWGRRLLAAGLVALFGLGLAVELASPVEAAPAESVECRNERDWRRDYNSHRDIPDGPEYAWFKTAIEKESDVDEGQGCTLAEHIPRRPCNTVNPDTYDGDWLLPDECWGTFPSESYTISWNAGLLDIKDSIIGTITSILFAVMRGIVQVVLWLVGEAFDFRIDRFASFSTNTANNYDAFVVGPFGLWELAWTVLLGFVGFKAVTGKLGMAGGELGMSVVMLAMATALMNDQTGAMDWVADSVQDTSTALMVAGNGENPALHSMDPGSAVRTMQRKIHEEFIEGPYYYINYGGEPQGECRTRINQIASTGYDGAGWAQRHLENAPGTACDRYAAFNGDMTVTRYLATQLSIVVALNLGVFVGLSALTLLFSKFLLALLFAVLPFAAVTVILPGAGRRMAWSWVGSAVQLAAAVIGTCFMLTLLLLGIDAVLATSDDMNLIQRWMLILLVMGSMFLARKRMLAGTKEMGERLADSMTRLSPAGANWAGSAKGLDLQGVDRGAHRSVSAPARVAQNRIAERRNAKRSFRNLEMMERRREGAQISFESQPPSTSGAAASAGAPSPNAGRFRKAVRVAKVANKAAQIAAGGDPRGDLAGAAAQGAGKVAGGGGRSGGRGNRKKGKPGRRTGPHGRRRSAHNQGTPRQKGRQGRPNRQVPRPGQRPKVGKKGQQPRTGKRRQPPVTPATARRGPANRGPGGGGPRTPTAPPLAPTPPGAGPNGPAPPPTPVGSAAGRGSGHQYTVRTPPQATPRRPRGSPPPQTANGPKVTVTMKTRAPRGFAPGPFRATPGGVVRGLGFLARHPLESAKQPFRATGDRLRFRRHVRQFNRTSRIYGHRGWE